MKKKILIWIVCILIISGWLAFFIEYVVAKNHIAQLQIRIEEIDSQLKSVGAISKNLDQSISDIKKMISEFEKIKVSLEQTRNKIDKASK